MPAIDEQLLFFPRVFSTAFEWFYSLLFSCSFSILLQLFIGKIRADWGSADSSQYHIQTDEGSIIFILYSNWFYSLWTDSIFSQSDEGPERFFRYQTDSGQFRNEKRLKDGTVIGTLLMNYVAKIKSGNSWNHAFVFVSLVTICEISNFTEQIWYKS